MRYSASIGKSAAVSILLLTLISGTTMGQESLAVHSPDGKIEVAFRIASPASGAGSCLSYAVTYEGQSLLANSSIDFSLEGEDDLLADLAVIKTDREAIDQTWQRVWGKCKTVRDHYNEMRVMLETKSEPKRRLAVIWRAYDDGVAFRYFLPLQSQIKGFKLTEERSQFRFGADHTVWAADYGQFTTHQEAEFTEGKLSSLKPGEIYGLPLLVQAGDLAWVAITEADLDDWAGMYVTAMSDTPNAVRTLLSPHPDDAKVCVESKTPRYSPWRTIMIVPKPGGLIESNLIANLNPPCALKDTSWIEPGMCAWDWWWCGRYAPDVDFKLGPNDKTMKYFIDFASEMGWRYQLVDWQWYGPPFADEVGGLAHPTSDITTCVPGIDVPALVKYAATKNVKLLVWLHWTHADKQMDKAFPLYEKWGVAGVKIDFMARDDQEMVEFYHRTVKKAAEHHLTVDFHGAYKPTGLSRTYPNLLTREGVMGNEYNKWSDRVTPDHCLTIPFTRMVAGPMDFTPGGFRHGTRESFKVVGGDEPAPMVYGTRAFQLAMLVVYESPLQVMCDTPYEYRNNPAGLDFLKIVPTTWDETRVLNGEVGDFITVARRLGGDWYIGSMTDWNARALEIPLDFLDAGRYEATVWADAADVDRGPAGLAEMHIEVSSEDHLTAQMVPGGGYVVHLKPVAP